MNIIFGIIVVLAFLFLVFRLWDVVTLDDDFFPGRNDKLMWAILVFFGSVLGAFLFGIWKNRHNKRLAEEAKLAESMRNCGSAK